MLEDLCSWNFCWLNAILDPQRAEQTFIATIEIDKDMTNDFSRNCSYCQTEGVDILFEKQMNKFSCQSGFRSLWTCKRKKNVMWMAGGLFRHLSVGCIDYRKIRYWPITIHCWTKMSSITLKNQYSVMICDII